MNKQKGRTFEVLLSSVVLLVDLGAGAVLVVPQVVTRRCEHVPPVFHAHGSLVILSVEVEVLVC